MLSGLAGMPAGKGTKMSLRDMPNARAARDTQAILSADIDWDAPELQNLSASARDFLERLLQVGGGVVGVLRGGGSVVSWGVRMGCGKHQDAGCWQGGLCLLADRLWLKCTAVLKGVCAHSCF